MHYFHGTWEEACIWSTVDVSSGTVLPWFACLHLSQEMSLEINEQAIVNTGLSLSAEDWMDVLAVSLLYHVFFSLCWNSWFFRVTWASGNLFSFLRSGHSSLVDHNDSLEIATVIMNLDQKNGFCIGCTYVSIPLLHAAPGLRLIL